VNLAVAWLVRHTGKHLQICVWFGSFTADYTPNSWPSHAPLTNWHAYWHSDGHPYIDPNNEDSVALQKPGP